MVEVSWTSLSALLGLIGPVAIIIALLVMAALSQRLGAVTRRSPLYRWFYTSVALIAFSVALRLFGIAAPDRFDPAQHPLYYDVPFALGLLIAIVIAWRYWSWLLSERGK